jgi:SpoVK/Ycf46/Vps4 family AAA+-type ATPase
LVKLTPGYVGADIHTLCKEASILAVQRIVEGKDKSESPIKNKTIDSLNAENGDSDIDALENFFIETEDFH